MLERVTNFYLKFANYIFLQSVKPVTQLKYLLRDCFWSVTVMFVLLCLNTVAAVQIFFIECIFVFLIWLFLKKVGIIISASKPHCHSRFSTPILKIQSIYGKNILGKQLPEAICSKYVFRLLHAPKSQVFSTKLDMMVKVIKLFTGVLWKSCSGEFYRKTPMRKCHF